MKKSYYAINFPVLFILLSLFHLLFEPRTSREGIEGKPATVGLSQNDVTTGSILPGQKPLVQQMPPREKTGKTTDDVPKLINPVSGFIGLDSIHTSDNPVDNVFYFEVSESDLENRTHALLKYKVYGLGSPVSVPKSLNNEPSTGGTMITAKAAWSDFSEYLSISQLRPGRNAVRFTVPDDYRLGYYVKDVKIAFDDSLEKTSDVTYSFGEQIFYAEEHLYLKGYVKEEVKSLLVNGMPVNIFKGLFEFSGKVGTDIPGELPVEILYENGKKTIENLKVEVLEGSSIQSEDFQIVNATFRVPATEKFTWVFEGMELSGNRKALNNVPDLYASALRGKDMPALKQGMINVTAGAQGYRLLPHNAVFSENLDLRIQIDTNKIPIGYSPADVRTFYFDETSNAWVVLPKTRNTASVLWASAVTNHFTDFINAIIKSPELPANLAHTSTSLSDIETPNPHENVSMIAAPTAQQDGSVRLSYPIIVPPGRKGLQPGLSLNYSSNHSNGWAGVGWDLNTPVISVDSRFGVPRYSSTHETEGYLMNGEELMASVTGALIHRTAFVARYGGSTKEFFPRVEGEFNKISRKGSGPGSYWWEVIDKNGTTYYYGKKSSQSGAHADYTLTDDNGNIARWFLAEIRDLNGNFVSYDYTLVQHSGYPGDNNMGKQKYLSSIQYTGHGSTPGKYTVEFLRNTHSQTRGDVFVNARNGFKEVTADLLTQIKVKYDGNLIRSYFLKYKTGGYSKSLLCMVVQTNEDETGLGYLNTLEQVCDMPTENIQVPEYYKIHKFDYHGMPEELFSEPVEFAGNASSIGDLSVSSFSNLVSLVKTTTQFSIEQLMPGVLFNPQKHVLSMSQDVGFGGGLGIYFGVGKTNTKNFSIGGSYNLAGNWNATQTLLMDIDGNGIPDRVFKNGNYIYYQPITIANGIPTLGLSELISGLPALNKSLTVSHSVGLQGVAPFNAASGHVGYSWSNTQLKKYFTDVNADGLVDFIEEGKVHFNKLNGNHVPYFTHFVTETIQTGDKPCEVIIHSGEVDPDLLDNGLVDHPVKSRLKDYSAVRIWKAPYSGYIKIEAPIQLIEDQTKARSQSLSVDGVRYTIQKNAQELLVNTIDKDDYTVHSNLMSPVYVNRGDEIYFRLQPKANRDFDEVYWSPSICYIQTTATGPLWNSHVENEEDEEEDLEEEASVLKSDDNEGKNIFCFSAQGDFLLLSEYENMMPLTGKIRIQGSIINTGLSDTVKFAIIPQNGAVYLNRILLPQSNNTIWIDTILSVTEDDVVKFQFQCNSKINHEKLKESFRVTYYEIESVTADTSNEMEKAEFIPVVTRSQLFTQVEKVAFPQTLSSTGSLTIHPRINFVSSYTGTYNGFMVFTLKSDGAVVGEKVIEFQNNVMVGDTVLTCTISNGSDLYFEWQIPNTELSNQIQYAGAKVVHNSTTSYVLAGVYATIPEALMKYGHMYNGWGQFGYNGSVTDPINQSLLQVTQAFNDPNNIPQVNVTYATDPATAMSDQSYADVLDAPFQKMNADLDSAMYRGFGELTSVGKTIQSNMLPKSVYHSEITESPIVVSTNIYEKKAPIKETKGDSWNLGFSVSGPSIFNAGGSWSIGSSTTSLDYMDLNGDGYPDNVSETKTQFSTPQGGLGDGSVSHIVAGEYQGTSHVSFYSISANTGGRSVKNLKLPYSGIKGTANTLEVTSTVGGNVAIGNNTIKTVFMDYNGDGLPDKLTNDGNIFLNIGYSFLPFQAWAIPEMDTSQSFSKAASWQLSDTNNFQNKVPMDKGENSWSVGLNASKGTSTNYKFPVDINGDGLIDFVNQDGDDVYFYINTGTQTVVLDNSEDYFAKRSTSFSLSGSGAATFGMNFFLGLKGGATGNLTLSYAKSIEKSQFIDVNGDGLPDFVYYDEHSNTSKVKYSNLQKVNLLYNVQTNLGNSVNWDYAFDPPTHNNPNGNWVMSALEEYDGYPGDGGDYKYFAFSYHDGFYNRYERAFWGYDSVVTMQMMGSSINHRYSVEKYHNTDFTFKGIKYFSGTYAANGDKFQETHYNYQKTEIATGQAVIPAQEHCFGVYYPALASSDAYLFDGNTTAQIHTRKEFTYGAFGNVVTYVNKGDMATTTDDLSTQITYKTPDLALNLVSLAEEVKVLNGATLLKQTNAQYNATTGLMTKVIHKIDGSTNAEHDYSYDAYGNVSVHTFPPNHNSEVYELAYEYETVTNSYVSKITDVFGLESNFTYDYRYGKPSLSTDASGNTIGYYYDKMGRLQCVIGPNDWSVTNGYSIRFEYTDSLVTSFAFPGEILWVTASRRDPQFVSNRFIKHSAYDPMGKHVQSKELKLVTTSGSQNYVFVISGWVVYDDLGRAIENYYPTSQAYGSGFDFAVSTTPDTESPTVTYFDVFDRPTKIITPDQEETNLSYGFGLDFNSIKRTKELVEDAEGNETYVLKDAFGRQIQMVRPYTNTTKFTYNALGNLLLSKDPENNTTNYTYDLLGRLKTRVHPDAGTNTLSYDPLGNLISEQHEMLYGSSQYITHAYEYNRRKETHYPVRPVNDIYYEYGQSGNDLGKVVKIQDGAGVHAMAYGTLGEVVSKTSTIVVPGGGAYTFGMAFEYDFWGRIVNITYPDGELVNYTYNPTGELIAVNGTKPGHTTKNYLFAAHYDKFGAKTATIKGDGSVQEYEYDPETRRLSKYYLRLPLGGSVSTVTNVTYTYDKVGNIVGIGNIASGANDYGIGSTFSYSYGYDDLYRLTSSDGSTGRDDSYYQMALQYSPSGNILSKITDAGRSLGGVQSVVNTNNEYSYGGAHTVGTVYETYGGGPPPLNYGWDVNGNMVYAEQYNPDYGQFGREMCWNERNELIASRDQIPDGYVSKYFYDGAGERVWKFSGQTIHVSNNGVPTSTISHVNLNLTTLYQSPYMTINDEGYTKHYYTESDRIASRIGGGFQNSLVGLGDNVEGIGEFHYGTFANTLYTNLVEDIACVGLGEEYIVYEAPLGIIDELSGKNLTENDVYFYHKDHLGSSSYMTDGSGYPTEHRQYMPFGEDMVYEANSSSYYTPYTFSAKERDMETSFSYFGARYYDAGLSIWLSVDPMSDKYPSLSPYNYCAWNPVMFIDPDGRQIDNYSVDEGGNIKFESAAPGPDVLHTKKNWDNGVKDKGQTVNDKSLLPQLAKERSDFTMKDFRGDVHKGSYGVTTNTQDAAKVFEFVSKNSDVEWTLEMYKGDKNFLGTNHSSDGVKSGFNVNGLGLNVLNLRIDIHSHPGISPKDDVASTFNGGDVGRAGNITKQFLKAGYGYDKLPKFQVYRPHVAKPHYFTYDAWTPRL